MYFTEEDPRDESHTFFIIMIKKHTFLYNILLVGV
jgi:hypothetical protein